MQATDCTLTLQACADELIYDLFRMRSGTFCSYRLKSPFIKAGVGVKCVRNFAEELS